MKVDEMRYPILQLPPSLDELQGFIFGDLRSKIPVIDSFYNSLVADNDFLKAMIEPVSLSGADILSALVVSVLKSEFEGGDKAVIAGDELG